ncbi:MAG: response regulator transcription factor [Bacteroidia bacterium]|nr:response regulator transcription factor [Bacteroidia bacterium]
MTENLNIVIVDDEPAAIQNVLDVVEPLPYCKTVISASDTETAIEEIRRVKPNVLILDIHLGLEDGFDLLDKLDHNEKDGLQVVFVTAYDQYAIQAFEYHVVNYLLKPLDADKLVDALDRIRASASQNTNELILDLKKSFEEIKQTNKPLSMRGKLVINDSSKVLIKNIDEVVYLTSNGGYTYIRFADHERTMISKTLKKVQSELPESHFCRIHNQHTVNLNYVEEFNWKTGEVDLGDFGKLQVSTRRRSNFFAQLKRLA